MSTEYLGSFGKLVNSKGLAGIRVGASKESCMGDNGELGWEEHRIPVGVSTEYLEESTEYLVG